MMANDYAALFKHYISLSKEFSFDECLENSTSLTMEVLNKIPEEKASFSYAEGKWNIKQVISHIIDTERIVSYRALRYARKDKTALPGFEEDEYATNSNVENRTLVLLLEEFKAVRKSTQLLFESFTDEMLTYYEPKGLTVEKIGRMIAGHSMHHCNVLVERYGIE